MPQPLRPTRTRPAAFFRAVVAAAVAAPAPAAGCYESSPEEDAADVAPADDGRETGETSTEDYGVPADAWDESIARYAVPMYGTP